MKKLSENLKKLITKHNLNTAELARATNVLQPVLHRLVSGNTDNPRIDTILPIAKYFKVTVNQLVGDQPLTLDTEFSLNEHDKTCSYSPIPLLNNWKEIEKFLSAPNDYTVDSWIGIDAVNYKDKTYCIKVKDSTMLPKFDENTLLIADPTLTPQNSDFVIVKSEELDEPVFKQIFYDGNDIYLKPLNNEFKTILLTTSSQYKFLGIIIETRNQLKSFQF